MSLTLGWNLTADPLASVGQNRLLLRAEHSRPGFLSSDFDFTKLSGQLDWRINTSRSRPFATTLDVRIIGTTHTGALPLQRFAVVEPGVWAYDLGALRTLEGRPFEGDQYLGVFWEHNFRGTVLEALGLGRRGQGMELIAEGAHARTWLSLENAPTGLPAAEHRGVVQRGRPVTERCPRLSPSRHDHATRRTWVWCHHQLGQTVLRQRRRDPYRGGPPPPAFSWARPRERLSYSSLLRRVSCFEERS